MLQAYFRNVFGSALLRVGHIPTWNVTISLLIQWFFLLVFEADADTLLYGVTFAYGYSVAMSLGKDQTHSIFAPVATGMTLVIPVCFLLSGLLGESVPTALLCFYPLLYDWILNRRAANATEHFDDSFFGDQRSRFLAETNLNEAGSIHELSEASLSAMRGSRPILIGPTVGVYRDQSIWNWIQTEDGTWYDFDSVIPEGIVYGLPANGVLIVPPGLIYLQRENQGGVK